jgi:hypothetical protein
MADDVKCLPVYMQTKKYDAFKKYCQERRMSMSGMATLFIQYGMDEGNPQSTRGLINQLLGVDKTAQIIRKYEVNQ